MSYSLVTFSCVIAFLSAIPRVISPILQGPAFVEVRTRLTEIGDLNPECTAPKKLDLRTMATAIKTASAVLTSESLDDIEETINSIFEQRKFLNRKELQITNIAVALEVLYGSKCTSAVSTLADDLPSLRKAALDIAKTELVKELKLSEKEKDVKTSEYWNEKGIIVACQVYNVLKALKTGYSDGLPTVSDQIKSVIAEVVNALDIESESSGIETKEIIPSFDLVYQALNSASRSSLIYTYYGGFLNEDDAKRSMVICYLFKGTYRRLNPQLSAELKQKLEDELYAKHEFDEECKGPDAQSIKSRAAELIKPGNILDGSKPRTTEATLQAIFDDAILTKGELETAKIAARRVSLPQPKCSDQSPSLGADDNALLVLADQHLKSLCGSKGCGSKRIGYKCQVSKELKALQASFAAGVESLPNELKDEVNLSVVERHQALTTRSATDEASSTTTADKAIEGVSLSILVKVFNRVKEKPKTKAWIENNAGNSAVVLCKIDTLLAEEYEKAKKDAAAPALPAYAYVVIALCVIIIIVIIVLAICFFLKRKE